MIPLTVLNSACLIGLGAIGRRDIIRSVCKTVLAPEAVRDEVGHLEEWMEVRPVGIRFLVASLLTQLHIGEAEAIALAAETEGAAVALDDKKARRIAAEMGIPVIGTLGMIIRAKRLGIIPNARQIIRDGLRDDQVQALGTDPHVMDSDQAFVIDGLEVNDYNTNPLDQNSDRDGTIDGIEIFYGLNPRVAESREVRNVRFAMNPTRPELLSIKRKLGRGPGLTEDGHRGGVRLIK